MCLCVCTQVLTSVFTVCMHEFLPLGYPWVIFVCEGRNSGRECNVFVCVCRPVFVGLTEASRHPGLMTTQLQRSTQNTSQEFSAWITRRDERQGERRHQKRCLGNIPGFLSGLGLLHFEPVRRAVWVIIMWL